jgi:NAD(P)-dependent dehydrogenase (short-subunit alcohol dehydrogenase family)
MSIDLSGQAAIVTGAGRGIGRATALELARLGAAVVVNDLGAATDGSGADDEPARRVAEEIEASGGSALCDTRSVSDYASAEQIVAGAMDRFGSVDILVNNAGLSDGTPIWALDPDRFQHVCASHLLGTFNCMRAALPQMRAAGRGRIVNLVSRAGLVGMPGNAAYGAGKGGVFGLTNVAARDLAGHGITVNAVNPAATDTRMVSEAIDRMRAQGDASAERIADSLSRSLQSPACVAAMISALCSEQAATVTGEIFYVSGREIGLFQPLSVTQRQSSEENWTSETVAEALGAFELHPLDAPYG